MSEPEAFSTGAAHALHTTSTNKSSCFLCPEVGSGHPPARRLDYTEVSIDNLAQKILFFTCGVPRTCNQSE